MGLWWSPNSLKLIWVGELTNPSNLSYSLTSHPSLQHKLSIFIRVFSQRPSHNKGDKDASPWTNLATLMTLDANVSQRYRLKCREILDNSIGVPPAYHTRIRDGIAIQPSQRMFNNACNLLWLPSLTSKTRETALKILHRTVWMNNKAFKSRKRPDPIVRCSVFNKFGSTAINCPRSLQILHCQRMLFCTLQRICSSVAIFSDYLIKKSLQFWRGLSCNMQTSNFRLCKRICCDCKTLIAQFKKFRRLL